MYETAFHRAISESHSVVPQQMRADFLSRSRQRALDVHRLDPANSSERNVATAQRLREHVSPIEPFLRTAQAGMRQLHGQLKDIGYVTLLADKTGLTVDYQSSIDFEQAVGKIYLGVGTSYAEPDEGTCGVGTCLVEQVPLTIHQREHYLHKNAGLSCTAAPVFAPSGDLLAVLCVGAAGSPVDHRSQQLVLKMVSSTARLIEDAWFCHLYRSHWLVNLATAPELLNVQVGGLVAVDDDGQVIAVNRIVRQFSGRTAAQACLHPTPLADLLLMHAHHTLQSAATQPALAAQLFASQTPTPVFCKITPPLKPSARSTKRQVAALTDLPSPDLPPDSLSLMNLGDPAMEKTVLLARRLATSSTPLVLLGETGTGKEKLAQAIHEASGRKGRFVAINCGAIPEPLVESELFGYRDGAFTGARAKGRRGKILDAHGGTLFLDEIGDMPLSLQTRLLRVLAEGEVSPLGSDSATPVDLRVVCATHQDLNQLLAKGLFRQDLFYRLNGAQLHLPPLRARRDQSALIDRLWRGQFCQPDSRFTPLGSDLKAQLAAHPWPGNIRQLQSVLRFIASTCTAKIATVDDLPDDFAATAGRLPVLPQANPTPQPQPNQSAADLVAMLQRHAWCVSHAATALGISRSTLHRKMKALGVISPNRR